VNATELVVQTDLQRRLARERFGRDATIIANPVLIPITEITAPEGRRYILWIGKSDGVKRPELVLDLAGACPEVRFRAIVNPIDLVLFEMLRREAPANLEIVERVEPAGMLREFSGAIALLNTSRFEGFPNAMLEAGACGVPVLSLTVDPNGILSREGGGFVAGGNIEALALAVRRFALEPGLATDAGARLQRYVRANHDGDARVAELAEVLIRLSQSHVTPRPGVA
jgi:glycosyltransferase involved in cell wall biosynthesis